MNILLSLSILFLKFISGWKPTKASHVHSTMWPTNTSIAYGASETTVITTGHVSNAVAAACFPTAGSINVDRSGGKTKKKVGLWTQSLVARRFEMNSFCKGFAKFTAHSSKK
jgi:hypothetical protein